MFSYRLKQLRNNSNLTQQDLAKLLNLTQSTIAYYESGRKLPTLTNAKLIAETFDTSLDYLVGISNEGIIQEKIEASPPPEQLWRDIKKLSPKSLKDLKCFVKYLEFRDRQDGQNRPHINYSTNE